MTPRVLVTGGAGFIGSHVVDVLTARGTAVTVLDDLSTGSLDNLGDADRQGDLRVVEGSILDADVLDRALVGCNVVLHLAVRGVRASLGLPEDNHETNATGTLRVLEAARQAHVDRFLYCSSSEVYGNASSERLTEDGTVPAPVTVYGAAKLAGEHYTQAYHQTYGLPTAVVRPFNSYGPREHDLGVSAEVIPRFVARVRNGLPPVIFGDGSAARDFTYVTETAAGIVAAGEAKKAIGRTLNLAFGSPHTVAEVADTVLRACGRSDMQPEFLDPRPGDVQHLHADLSLARRLIGFQAHVGFDEGIKSYLDWVVRHRPDAATTLDPEVVNWRMPKAAAHE